MKDMDGDYIKRLSKATSINVYCADTPTVHKKLRTQARLPRTTVDTRAVTNLGIVRSYNTST